MLFSARRELPYMITSGDSSNEIFGNLNVGGNNISDFVPSGTM